MFIINRKEEYFKNCDISVAQKLARSDAKNARKKQERENEGFVVIIINDLDTIAETVLKMFFVWSNVIRKRHMFCYVHLRKETARHAITTY